MWTFPLLHSLLILGHHDLTLSNIMAHEGHTRCNGNCRCRGRRPPSPVPIMNSNRSKIDLHHDIETFVKGRLFGDEDALAKGKKERKERHKAWADNDKIYLETIKASRKSKKSKKESKGSKAISFMAFAVGDPRIALLRKTTKRKHKPRPDKVVEEKVTTWMGTSSEESLPENNPPGESKPPEESQPLADLKPPDDQDLSLDGPPLEGPPKEVNTEENRVGIEARSSTDDIEAIGVVKNSESSDSEAETKEAKGEVRFSPIHQNSSLFLPNFILLLAVFSFILADIAPILVGHSLVHPITRFGATLARMKPRPARVRGIGMCREITRPYLSTDASLATLCPREVVIGRPDKGGVEII